jgi:hypothetical protein
MIIAVRYGMTDAKIGSEQRQSGNHPPIAPAAYAEETAPD